MDFTSHYKSPLGDITLASDGDFLIGLWFDGQKYFGETLQLARPEPERKHAEQQHFAGTVASTSHELAQRSAIQQHIAGAIPYISNAMAQRAVLPVFAETRRWLDIYFSGKNPSFTPPLLMRTTPFRKEVWEILLAIPYGKTATYGEISAILAKKRGVPYMSAQAVGNAVGHNAISLIIPCHRVVGANGSLTGYAAGIPRKAWLLEQEKGVCN